ncbi:hypothetical protein BZG36_05262 [Bifiguratus adelaidae]|uniref:EXPERA domain-containing protein n=1 Tax=Bifiguratus adelaidae TaxID=1938954 RepID=A0A261XTU4_9FUNG|nr:hypothetical protein BZG36_05262 [Bifiguratus adelaidae]
MAPIPLSERPLDKYWFIPFFVLNIAVITYMIDIEQVTTMPPIAGKPYPWWPPRAVVDIVRWYGYKYDPLLIARPPFWRASIYYDIFFFGPFYFYAIHAFTKGINAIRIPAIIFGTCLTTVVTLILMEEIYGEYAAHDPFFVVGVNLPWLITPIAIVYRMWMGGERPFDTDKKTC